MKTSHSFLALGALSIALAACGGAEDASTEARADTVEVPAEEALAPVSEEPVADEALESSEEVEGTPAVTEEAANSAAETAASIAAEAEEAANEAEEAAQAANAALDSIGDSIGDAADAVEEIVD